MRLLKVLTKQTNLTASNWSTCSCYKILESLGRNDRNQTKILNEPNKVLKLITFILNDVLRIQYFIAQWKVAQVVILIQKPDKLAPETSSW